MAKMAKKVRRSGLQVPLAVLAMGLLLAAGAFGAVLLTKQAAPATAASVNCNDGGNSKHYIVGPCGYDKGNFSLIVAGSSTPTLSSGDKVVICHRTGSHSNPYVQIPPDVSGVVHGHYDEHPGPVYPATGSDGKWGDIIPPFIYQGQTYSMNWTTQGQAIYNNGCNLPSGGTTTGTTTGHTTTGSTTTTGTTTGSTTTGHTTTVGTTTTVPGQTTTVTTPGQTTTNTRTVTGPTQTVTTPTQTVTVTTPGKTTTVTHTVTVTKPGKTKVVVHKQVVVHVKKVNVPTKGHLAYTK